MTHKLTATMAAALLVIGAAGTAAAAPLTLNVDFGFANQPANVYNGTGAAPDAGTHWNGLSFGGGDNLLDSYGLATGIDVRTTASQAYSDGGHALLRDRIFVTKSWGPFKVTIDGLTDSVYDLYVYGSNTRYGSVSTVGSVSDYALGQLNAPSGFVRHDHYALLQGLIPVNGTITIDVTRYAGSQAAVIAGLQLQQVPEPGSLLLLGTGLVGAVLAVRKRRQ